MGTDTEEKFGILTLGTTSDRSTSLIEHPITHSNNHRVAFETRVLVDWEGRRITRKI